MTSVGGAAPTATGFYGPTDGGTDPGAWGASVSLGSVNGTATTDLTKLNPATNYYFRVRAENAGGESWAAASAGFTTLAVILPAVENRSATGITKGGVQNVTIASPTDDSDGDTVLNGIERRGNPICPRPAVVGGGRWDKRHR